MGVGEPKIQRLKQKETYFIYLCIYILALYTHHTAYKGGVEAEEPEGLNA